VGKGIWHPFSEGGKKRKKKKKKEKRTFRMDVPLWGDDGRCFEKRGDLFTWGKKKK